MSRVTKELAHELILFAKRIDVKANAWDSRARSAFEFHRQMSSPKLKKINPSFECNLEMHEKSDPPLVLAEFVDGTKWELDSSKLKANEVRSEFFSRAEDAEEAMERVDNKSGGDDAGGVSGKKGGSKGAAKK